jgi:saccharopine dehydrogenase-like NADP-dependent oxidoreductase
MLNFASMLRKLLLFGAGKSASYLINYFIGKAEEENWALTVADTHTGHLRERYAGCAALSISEVSADDEASCMQLVSDHDLVISLLPAFLHIRIARWCLAAGKSLVTASYVDAPMQQLDAEAKAKGLIFLNEAGLDPGLDHLSAMALIAELKEKKAEILSFASYTGGLVAKSSDSNPWHYKFSWNPRNVVLAGQGSCARYLDNGKYKYISYPRLFKHTTRFDLKENGIYEGYPNRDSLKYIRHYGLENISQMQRGTLRGEGFCKSWNVFVQLGMTDDSFIMETKSPVSKKEFLNSFLPSFKGMEPEEKLRQQLGADIDDEILENLAYLGLFSDREFLTLKEASPAGHLQSILEEKWKLEENDKDLVVMVHRIKYRHEGKSYLLESSLVTEGENAAYTAMAKTVGIPVAIAAKLILNGKIPEKGVHIPLRDYWYRPVLRELREYGIVFKDRITIE